MGKMAIIMLWIVLMFSYVGANEKEPTIFTKSLGRDINGDGKIDSAVIVKDFYHSISYLDDWGNIYICRRLWNEEEKDYNICIIKILSNGKIDESFGSKGKTMIQEYGMLSSMFVDKYGNIFIALKYVNKVCVIKIKNNGSLDNDFGKGGKKSLISIGREKHDKVESILSIYVDKSGSIFVGGYTVRKKDMKGKAYVVKMKANGEFDENFGNQGKVMLNVGYSGDHELPASVYVDKDGNIFIAGTIIRANFMDLIRKVIEKAIKKEFTVDADAFVVKLKKDGTIDKSFGKRGKVVLNKIVDRETYDAATLMFVDEEGNIFIGGTCGKVYGKMGFRYPYIIKIKKDGIIDKSFGKEGKVVFEDIGGVGGVKSYCKSIYVDKNGNILASFIKQREVYTSYVVKLKSNGDIDETFGNKGKIILDNIVEGNENTIVSLVKEDREGNILIIGNSFNKQNREKGATFVMKFPFFR